MFDPVEADLAAYEREQDELMREEEMIEGAVSSFLEECCQIPAFKLFLEKGLVTLDELADALCDCAEIEDGEVVFPNQDPNEFVEIVIRDWGE